MVIVKTEFCDPDLTDLTDLNIKQEPESQPSVRTNYQPDCLIDLTENTNDPLPDMIIRDQFKETETEASQCKDDCQMDGDGEFHIKRKEELKEDLLLERSNEIVEKSKRRDITEEKNHLNKKIEKKRKKSTNKKIENLRLVRKEGFFTINPDKNQMKTFNRTGQNKNTSSR